MKTLKPIYGEETNKYNGNDYKYKKEAQKIMTSFLANSKVKGLILTLPYIYCIIEKAINKTNKNLRFLGVECIKDTFKKMKKVIEKENLPIKPYFGKIQDKIFGAKENAYAHLILDYCGCLSTYLDEIRYVFRNKIVKKHGYVCMTFSVPIISNVGNHKLVKDNGRYECNNKNDNRTLCEKGIHETICKVMGEDYDIVEIFKYNDTKIDKKGKLHRGMPMILIIVKRIK